MSTPRPVIYGAACSLDGFITARDGALDWLHFSADAQEVMGATFAGADTILMGRRTWEFAMANAPTSSGATDGIPSPPHVTAGHRNRM